MKFLLHPKARTDLEEAINFYERTGSLTLAAKFVAEFKRVSQLLLEFPDMGSPRSHGRQGFSMAIFPYTLIYRVNIEGILLLVVKHDSRRPSFGESRK